MKINTGGTTGSTVDKNGLTHRKGVANTKLSQSGDYIDPFEIETSYTVDEGRYTPEEKRQIWSVASGLQAVDGIKPSKYMEGLIEQNIEDKKTYPELEAEVKKYYNNQQEPDIDEKEADIVTLRISQLLASNSFTFSPQELRNFHKFLFSDIYDFAGRHKTQVLTKGESILGGYSVRYGNPAFIDDNLDDAIRREKRFDYIDKDDTEKITRIADFTSEIWQIHPFAEGNTRTTAVFLMKHLQDLGFKVNNKPFRDNSLYYRNALVRSCFTIKMTDKYLIKFFENAILGHNNTLDNNDLDISEVVRETVGDGKR